MPAHSHSPVSLLFIVLLCVARANACESFEIHVKQDLWSKRACLRGANIYQKVIEPGDDLNAIGPGPLGPPYSANSFGQLARWGANLVNISHPGIFTVKPPYALHPEVQKNLDDLIQKAEQADLFVVISFRTGPGRSDKALSSNGTAEDHRMWKDRAAQDAWVEMWKATAQRYKNQRAVIGYDLMVEPNSNGALLDLYDPEPFFQKYENTLYNWYPLAERIATAVRAIDTKTPILVGGMNWSSVSWLHTIPSWNLPYLVYVAHQYEPFVYTHQKAPFPNVYPGAFDADQDGTLDLVTQAYLKKILQPILDFQKQRSAPVTVNEFGAARWQPGAQYFLRDQFEIFDAMGVSSAIWTWESDYPGIDWDDFNFRHGPDPSNHVDVPSDLEWEIRSAWSENNVRLKRLWGDW